MNNTPEEKARKYANDLDGEYILHDQCGIIAYSKSQIRDSFVAGFNSASSELQQLREALRWRDVKEELPEVGKMVLIKYNDRKFENLYAFGRVYESIGKYEWSIQSFFENKGTVTHWRPIESGEGKG